MHDLPSGPTHWPVVGAAERYRRGPNMPDDPQRTTVGIHSSPVRPATGQQARATPPATATRPIVTLTAFGCDRRAITATTSPPATDAIWPPRQPAMSPRRSSGPKR